MLHIHWCMIKFTKNRAETMLHYNTLNDNILENKDLDRIEENNGLVSVHVFEPDNALNDDR